MNLTFIAFILSLSLLSTTGLAHAAEPQRTCQRLDIGQLCLQQASELDEAHWFWQPAQGTQQPLPALPSAMQAIVEFQPDPLGIWLALVSVGEGHGILEIFDLQAWIAKQPLMPLYSINPYPGWITLEGWSDGRLRFSTDRQLPQQIEKNIEITDLPETDTGTDSHYILELESGILQPSIAH